MSLIVQKFGGSSLASAERVLHAAHIIKDSLSEGGKRIVVVSAQGDTTDDLLRKAKELYSEPPPRELDALLATGEAASAALTAIALASLGVPAVSLGAWQAEIQTEDAHGGAQITAVSRERIERELTAGKTVVVAGFQGIDSLGDLTTLGRGGSDTSAAALAAAFGAERCEIYTDVDGVYTADPRVCPAARRLEEISYRHMRLLAEAGAQVLHGRSVEIAERENVALVVRSCRRGSVGTRVTREDSAAPVTGVARLAEEDRPLAAITIVGRAVPSLSCERAAVTALTEADIDVCAVGEREHSLLLYVPRTRADEALRIVHRAVLE